MKCRIRLNPKTAKEKLYTKWLKDLTKKLDYLNECYLNQSSGYLTQENLDILGIELSEIDFTTGAPLSPCSTMQFFKPTENSNWSLKDAQEFPVSLQEEFDEAKFPSRFNAPDEHVYMTQRASAFISLFDKHFGLLREKNINTCRWEYIPFDFLMQLLDIEENHETYENAIPYRVIGGKKPHIMLFMNTQCDAQNGKLASIEVFEIVWNILQEMIRQVFNEGYHKNTWPDDSALQLIFPVLVFSVFGPTYGRFMQCHFDGKLKIEYSRFEDFDRPQFPQLFETAIKWTDPVLCGNTLSITTAGDEKEQSPVNPGNIVKHMGALQIR